jgi:hypothetical protein
VLSVKGRSAVLDLDQGPTEASIAMPYAYEPRAGDEVLAAVAEEAFVLGVLSTGGPARLSAPGDLVISAGGRLRLEAGSRIETRAPLLRLVADVVETTAGKLLQRLSTCYTWVSSVLQTRAGRVRTHVDGHYGVKAERITEYADKDVKIDGRSVHLG